jgi:transposase
MKKLLDISAILKLKEKGLSNRAIAKTLGIDKKTVNKYWNEYKSNFEKLETTNNSKEILAIQENIISKPKYNSESRVRRKITPEFLNALKLILEDEEHKQKVLGTNKQALTKKQIHEILKKQGFSASYSTVVLEMKKIQNSGNECFIRQDYDFGDRLEYDFGEVKLVINGILKKYYIAVISSPASNFRWCYLYDNCKKDIFLDSHVRFFKMIGGVWKEIVYDNMRNVVSKFLGKNEKELNEDLVKMSIYYGFSINVTNAFSGNEKGYVEGSVKYLRNQIFAENYKFETEKSAIEYMESQLMKLNENSKIEEEKKKLKQERPPLELANIRQSFVNKYSFVQIDNNFYSVPEYLVGLKVTSKIYYNKILIYSNNEFVCEHKKIDGEKKISADIRHYLKTLIFKPGALKNSYVLKSNPKLKSIFNNYYINNPKKFIDIIEKNKEKNNEEIENILVTNSGNLIENVRHNNNINNLARMQTNMYNKIMIGVVNK